MNYCVKEKIREVAEVASKPILKNKISCNMGLYKDENSQTPEMELNYNGNYELKLITAVAVTVGISITVCVCLKICKMLNW